MYGVRVQVLLFVLNHPKPRVSGQVASRANEGDESLSEASSSSLGFKVELRFRSLGLRV